LISAGAPPQTLLGELTALPQTPSWIKGRNWRGAKGNGKGKGRRKGREREERGRGTV